MSWSHCWSLGVEAVGSHLTSALSCLSIFTYSEGGMWLRVGNNVCKQPFSCQVDPCKGRDIHMLPTAKVPFRHYASVGVVLLLVFPLYPPTLYSVTSKKTPLHFSELFFPICPKHSHLRILYAPQHF